MHVYDVLSHMKSIFATHKKFLTIYLSTSFVKTTFREKIRASHTVTKVKRNVQKLTLVGFEPMTPSRGAQINALDH